MYLITLSDSRKLLARIAFPYPHGVRTGDAFAYQEGYDRARLPSRMQSEACDHLMSELALYPNYSLVQVVTIRHIQTHTNIPVAHIFAYDNNLANPIGSPYTLQEVVCQADLIF